MATLDRNRVREAVCTVVAQHLQIDAKQVDTTKSFVDLDIDSIDAIEMQMAIEQLLEVNLFDGPLHELELQSLTLESFIDKILALGEQTPK